MNEDADRADVPSADRFSTLWQRTKEHRIAQWTVGYVAVAYGIQHAVTLTSEAFKWPEAVIRISMLLLALGLPIAMTVAWYHGERVSRRVSGGEAAIVSLLLVLISFAFYSVVRPQVTQQTLATQEANLTAARQASLSPATAISVAVMPFANFSGDASQDFFSDGITEEISGALAKIPDLRVVARSSAFQFKGKNQDARAMAQALGATHLIEGSVRRSGDRLRITAELVKADDGLRIWSDNYDREMTDVFTIQEDIARAIAASLRMPLGLKPGSNLVNSRTKDEALHEEYLRARALVRTRTGNLAGQGLKGMTEATQRLGEVVAREPDFAPAWALQALAYGYIPLFNPAVARGEITAARSVVADALPKGEAAATRAIKLDPDNADGYFALGFIQHVSGRQLAAMESLSKAIALDPTNPDGLHTYSAVLADLGYVKTAVPLRRKLQTLEPFIPIFIDVTGRILVAAGYYDEVTKLRGAMSRDIALAYAAEGRYGEAADALQGIPGADATARLMRGAPAKPQTLAELGRLDVFYVYVGVPERVMDRYERGLKTGYISPGDDIYLWAPNLAPVRKMERFKAYMRAAGMVDYWRVKGWPDLCHPVGADDFACN